MADIANKDLALSWDDEFDEGSFIDLENGDYHVTVTKFERAQFNGSEKLPAAPMAVIELTIPYQGADVKIKYQIVLCKTLAFKSHQLFESVGLIKKGSGAQKLPWEQLVGRSGICKIGHREYNGQSYMDIKQTYAPEDAPRVTKNQPIEETAPKFSL